MGGGGGGVAGAEVGWCKGCYGDVEVGAGRGVSVGLGQVLGGERRRGEEKDGKEGKGRTSSKWGLG